MHLEECRTRFAKLYPEKLTATAEAAGQKETTAQPATAVASHQPQEQPPNRARLDGKQLPRSFGQKRVRAAMSETDEMENADEEKMKELLKRKATTTEPSKDDEENEVE